MEYNNQNNQTLLCHKCKLELPISDFYPHSTYKRGYQYYCKKCCANTAKEYGSTEHGKQVKNAIGKKFRQTEKGKLTSKICSKRFKSSEAGKRSIDKYEKSDKRKQSNLRRFEANKLIPLDTTTKICTKCKRVLPLTEFFKNDWGKFGRKSKCKDCELPTIKNYKNSEHGKETLSQWMKTDNYKKAYKISNIRYRNSPKGKTAQRNFRKKYDKTEKGKVAIARHNHNRRTAIKSLVATLTIEEWEAIKKRYKYRCVYCGEKKKLTKDHIIPVSQKGPMTKENIVPACKPCNSKKHIKPVLLQLLAMDKPQEPVYVA